MQYNRIFIALACEAKGFEYKGRQPVGNCVLEARGGAGKLACRVQDLKPETHYGIYLIFASGGGYAGVPVCPLSVDAKGKAEIRQDLDAENVCAHGFALSECVAVAVMATRAAEPTAPLCGYRESSVTWRRTFTDLSRKPVQKVTAPAPMPVEAPVAKLEREELAILLAPFEEAEEDDAPVFDPDPEAENIQRTPVFSPEPEADHALVFDPEPEAAHAPFLAFESEPDPTSTSEAEAEPVFAPEHGVPEEYASEEYASEEYASEETAPASLNDMVHQFHMALERLSHDPPDKQKLPESAEQILQKIVNDHVPVYPFRKQGREVKWVRISPADHVPIGQPGLFDEAFIKDAYRQHNHCLLGVTTDGGRRMYILGVPGLYGHETRPQAMRLGFSQFKCCDDTRTVRGEYGYWLMFFHA